MKDNKNTLKKWGTVAGGLLICGVLVAMISSQLAGSASEITAVTSTSTLEASSTSSPDVTVRPIVPETSSLQEEVPESVPPESLVTGEHDVPETQQSIQPEVTMPSTDPPAEKPKVEDEQALNNPEQPPVYNPEETAKAPDQNKPQNGDVREDGAVYINGFGWIEYSGPNQGGTVGSPDDELTGNKVGIM